MGKGARVAAVRVKAPQQVLRRTETKVAAVGRHVLEAQVVEILSDGRARVLTGDGQRIDCRCAQSIDLPWLRAALAVGPVDAEISTGERGGSLWAIFAGPEHASVTPERVEISASSSVELRCGESTVSLKKDGRVRVRGRDVLARGSRVTRVQGHTIRLN